MEQKASLFIDEKDGEVGLLLENDVPASMKDAQYKVKCAFTKDKLLACKCQCHAGGDKNQRVVCVHTLPVIYQLTMLLDDGLAEHLLIELCSRWDTDLEDIVEENDLFSQMRKDIKLLMRHNGDSEAKIKKVMSQPTIHDILQAGYATGTECQKKIPRPPAARKLRPLREKDFQSNVTKAKERRKHEIKKKKVIMKKRETKIKQFKY